MTTFESFIEGALFKQRQLGIMVRGELWLENVGQQLLRFKSPFMCSARGVTWNVVSYSPSFGNYGPENTCVVILNVMTQYPTHAPQHRNNTLYTISDISTFWRQFLTNADSDFKQKSICRLLVKYVVFNQMIINRTFHAYIFTNTKVFLVWFEELLTMGTRHWQHDCKHSS